MNVAEKVLEILPQLKRFNGVSLPELRPSGKEYWTEGYASLGNLYYEIWEDSGEYFEHDRFKKEYEEMVRSLVPGIMVEFNWRSQDLEFIKEPTPSI